MGNKYNEEEKKEDNGDWLLGSREGIRWGDEDSSGDSSMNADILRILILYVAQPTSLSKRKVLYCSHSGPSRVCDTHLAWQIQLSS